MCIYNTHLYIILCVCIYIYVICIYYQYILYILLYISNYVYVYIYTIQYHFQNMEGSIAKYCEIGHKLTATALESLQNLEDTSAVLHTSFPSCAVETGWNLWDSLQRCSEWALCFDRASWWKLSRAIPFHWDYGYSIKKCLNIFESCSNNQIP